jgi:hypothetical protein
MIEKMDEELTKVIEDFNRTVNVETLRLTKQIRKQSLSQSGTRKFSVAVSCRA